ncbi:MAG: hypothetical protein NXI31_26470 [bacterium]|nr:hypothetical protein [bacterium]
MRVVIVVIALLLVGAAVAQDARDRKLATIPEKFGDFGFRGVAGFDAELVWPRFVFGPGGSYVAYNAVGTDSCTAMCNDEELGTFSRVESPVVDPTGQHFAFRCWNRKGKTGLEAFVVTRDRVHDGFRWIGPVAVNQEGVLAFWEWPQATAGVGVLRRGAAKLRVGKKRSRRFEAAPYEDPPVFAPDGEQLATLAMRKKRWLLLRGRGMPKAQKPLEHTVEEIEFSPDGLQVAYTMLVEDQVKMGATLDGRLGAKRYVLYGEEKLGLDAVEAAAPRFGPKGEHLVFRYSRGRGTAIAFRGEELPAVEGGFVGEPAFDRSGATIAYAKMRDCDLPRWAWFRRRWPMPLNSGVWSLHKRTKNGKPETIVDACDWIAHVTFGPNGELAYAQMLRGKWFLVVDGRRSEACKAVGRPWWSADGKRVEFGALRGREFWWKVFELE